MNNLKEILSRDSLLFQDDIDLNIEDIHKEFCDKKILVLGAAGSIGSAFVKEILRFNLSTIHLLDY